MTIVLVDTNVLIALVDSSDDLHARAVKDLAKLKGADLRVSSAVLSEAAFALPRRDQRGRLTAFVEELPISPIVSDDEAALRRDVFRWWDRYSDHDPDYADAELCVVVGYDKRYRVWTYDSEFRSVWRKLDGKRVPVIGAS
jgi:predicted nucleic acid-binding protein